MTLSLIVLIVQSEKRIIPAELMIIIEDILAFTVITCVDIVQGKCCRNKQYINLSRFIKVPLLANKLIFMQIHSEFSALKGVIIHEPDIGIGHITPEVAEQLLYDDIVFLPRMIEEHYVFTQAIRALIGQEHVFEVEELLADILSVPDVRKRLLEELKAIEQLSDPIITALYGMDARELSQVLVSGLDNEHTTWLKPLPNLVFTRDLGCVIHEHILISKMKKSARMRESFLFRSVIREHPSMISFRNKTIDLLDENDPDNELSIEGGDVMIVHPEYVLIGVSERTSWAGFLVVKDILLNRGIVKNVVAVRLPAERYCMHLDTVFTVISEKFCVGYAPLVFEPNGALDVLKFTSGYSGRSSYASLKDLMREIYPEMTFISCGNGISPFDAREQWTDGANLVAIDRNIAFAYERNVHTLQALKKAGFSVVDARHLIQYTDEEKKELLANPCIITISSAELSRARGGPHCMTMPLKRIKG